MSTTIKQPTVSEKWTEALEIMKEAKISKKTQTLLENIYGPKSASSVNPPIYDADGVMIKSFDRWFNQYTPINEAVLSNGKPKGYSKSSLSLWNKYAAASKELWEPLMEAGLSMTEIKEEIITAKKMMNDPKSFDYDRDTKRFYDRIKIEVSWNIDDKVWDIEEIIEEED